MTFNDGTVSFSWSKPFGIQDYCQKDMLTEYLDKLVKIFEALVENFISQRDYKEFFQKLESFLFPLK